MVRSPVRPVIIGAARSPRIESLITRAPVSSGVVRRFVGGPDTDAAVAAALRLQRDGLTVTLDHLGEDTTDREQADAAVGAYLTLLDALHAAEATGPVPGAGRLTGRVDVSVKLTAVGLLLGRDGAKLALDNARTIADAARRVGATVTLDAEDHTTTDPTLGVLHELRADFPETAAVLQAYLRRTEGDCRVLAGPGSRVRLCKGAYDEPPAVAYQHRRDVDLSYVRCANVLLGGGGYPMFATHDPTLIDIVCARIAGRARDSYELQLLYGVRPAEQRRLAAAGHLVRVYLPYGGQWYAYLMRRLAERPANLAFFARALVSRG